MSFEKELNKIMCIELNELWVLDLNPSTERKGWDGMTVEKTKRIILYYRDDMDFFHGFLHELAHAIEIEKRPNKKGDSHDVFFADTLTKLMGKYTISKKKVKEIINNSLITKPTLAAHHGYNGALLELINELKL